MTPTDQKDLKGKLAERAKPGTSVEPAKGAPGLATVIRQAIDRQSEAFRAVLPATVDSDRFSRLVLTAVKATPELARCFETTQGQTSVLLAAMQAAAIGLEPNTPRQHCWLLPRKRGGTTECELQIGYRGYLKLARSSGTVKEAFAQVVREKDHFEWARGLEKDHLEWRPYDGDDEDAGEMTHVFAVVRFTNGGTQFVVMNRQQVEKRRAVSSSFRSQNNQHSPWLTWTEEMWCKTAIKALVPYLDLDAALEDAVQRDERSLRIDDEGVIDVDPEPEPEPKPRPAPARPKPPADLPPAADDDAARETARKALMVQATKAFPLTTMSGKAQRDQRDVLRRAVAYCELGGVHKSTTQMTVAELRKVEARLMEVEEGLIRVSLSDDGQVLVQARDQEPIAVDPAVLTEGEN